MRDTKSAGWRPLEGEDIEIALFSHGEECDEFWDEGVLEVGCARSNLFNRRVRIVFADKFQVFPESIRFADRTNSREAIEDHILSGIFSEVSFDEKYRGDNFWIDGRIFSQSVKGRTIFFEECPPLLQFFDGTAYT